MGREPLFKTCSKARNMAVAKASASSLLLKFSPNTCLLSLHWWNVGVAWLYFKPFRMAQFITTSWSCSFRPTTRKVLLTRWWYMCTFDNPSEVPLGIHFLFTSS